MKVKDRICDLVFIVVFTLIVASYLHVCLLWMHQVEQDYRIEQLENGVNEIKEIVGGKNG